MIIEAGTVFTAAQLYEALKYWLPMTGLAVGLYKAFDWIKTKACKIDKIQEGVDSLETSISTQTSQVVSELKELRSDIRTFYSPQIMNNIAPRGRPSRTKAAA